MMLFLSYTAACSLPSESDDVGHVLDAFKTLRNQAIVCLLKLRYLMPFTAHTSQSTRNISLGLQPHSLPTLF